MIELVPYSKVVCDGCAYYGPLFQLAESARLWALQAGWHEFGDGTWLCPGCCERRDSAPQPTHTVAGGPQR